MSFLNAQENITFLINQKYICLNLGTLVNGKIIPAVNNNDYVKYPIRFYINGKKLLFTDSKTDNKYTYDEKNDFYIGENSAINLSIKDGVRYMINMPIKGDQKGIPSIYNCNKTERWSLY